MSEFRRVTPDFAVSPQLLAEDFPAAAAAGFVAVINNRPDGEAFGQISDHDARAAAEKAGLAYFAAPIAGPPSAAALDQVQDALSKAGGPVLAYCRTGTRSITAWALSQARARARGVDEIIALAADAGYDLRGARGALMQLYGDQ